MAEDLIDKLQRTVKESAEYCIRCSHAFDSGDMVSARNYRIKKDSALQQMKEAMNILFPDFVPKIDMLSSECSNCYISQNERFYERVISLDDEVQDDSIKESA